VERRPPTDAAKQLLAAVTDKQNRSVSNHPGLVIPASDPRLKRAAEWLKPKQQACGGWGETPQNYDDPSLRVTGTRPLTPTPKMDCARPKEPGAADAGLSRAPASSAVLIKVMAAIGGSTAYFVST